LHYQYPLQRASGRTADNCLIQRSSSSVHRGRAVRVIARGENPAVRKLLRAPLSSDRNPARLASRIRPGLRLVVLQPKQWYAKEEARVALTLEFTRSNGSKPRYRANRILFLAADPGALTRLNDVARVVLAWESTSCTIWRSGARSAGPSTERSSCVSCVPWTISSRPKHWRRASRRQSSGC
jgi:hypothetical protein